MKVKVNRTFSTVVMVDGTNIYLRGEKGETIDLQAHLVALVEHDASGTLSEVKPQPKRARQVTSAPNRKVTSGDD